MASSVLGNGSAYSDRYKVIRQQQSALKTQSQVALLTEKGQTLSDLRKENTKRRKALELERKRKEEQEQAKRIEVLEKRKQEQRQYVENMRRLISHSKRGAKDQAVVELEKTEIAPPAPPQPPPQGQEEEVVVEVKRIARAEDVEVGPSRYERSRNLYDSLEDDENEDEEEEGVVDVDEVLASHHTSESQSRVKWQAPVAPVDQRAFVVPVEPAVRNPPPPSSSSVAVKRRSHARPAPAPAPAPAVATPSATVASLDLSAGSMRGMLDAARAAGDVAAIPEARRAAAVVVPIQRRVVNPHEAAARQRKALVLKDSTPIAYHPAPREAPIGLGDLSAIPVGAWQGSVLDSLDLEAPALLHHPPRVPVAKPPRPQAPQGPGYAAQLQRPAKRGPDSHPHGHVAWQLQPSRDVPDPLEGEAELLEPAVRPQKAPAPAVRPKTPERGARPPPAPSVVAAVPVQPLARPTTAEILGNRRVGGRKERAPETSDSTQLFLTAEELARGSGLTATQILSAVYANANAPSDDLAGPNAPPVTMVGGGAAARRKAPTMISIEEMNLAASIARLDLKLKAKEESLSQIMDDASSIFAASEAKGSVVSSSSKRSKSTATGAPPSMRQRKK